MHRWAPAAPVASIGFVVARLAGAQAPPPHFGDASQLVFSDDTQGSVQVQTNGASPTITTITLGPAADYFVLRAASIGVHVLWQHIETSGAPTTDSWSAGIRLGYALRIGEAFSFWPKVNFDYRRTSLVPIVTAAAAENETHFDAMVIGVFAPVLFHPVAHFFIGLGPNVQTVVLTSASSDTTYGLMLTLGGWFALGPS